MSSQAKYAQLVNDYDIRGAGYAKSILDLTLDMAMTVGVITCAANAASLTSRAIGAAVEEFIAKGAWKSAAARAYGGAMFFGAIGVGSEYDSYRKFSDAMARLNTDAAGSLGELSTMLHSAAQKAGSDGGRLEGLAWAVDGARSELARQLKERPFYIPDTGKFAAYFAESFVQLFIMDAGFGFFKPAAAPKAKPKILEQKISRAVPKMAEVPSQAKPLVEVRFSAKQASAITKIDAGLDAQIQLLQTAASGSGAEAAAAKKQLAAISSLKEMFAYERAGYLAWADGLKEKGKFTKAEGDAYFGRMMDWEKQQSGKRNVAGMASKPAPENVRLETKMALLQPGVNKDALVNVMKEGVYCERLMDPNSRGFKEAYAMLRKYFPSDELDPATDLVEMQVQNTRNFAKLCTKDYAKVAPDLSAPLYQRYYLIVAKDRDGKIIGVCDGNFIGTKKASAMYWAHVAVPEPQRRRGIATLLYSSTLDLGNEMAHAADQSFAKIGIKAAYNTSIPGNKLKYFVLETEPVNQESQDAVAITWGRLLFHGSLGLSVIPKLRYVQIDLESERGVPFRQQESGGVPLTLAFSEVGSDGTPAATAGMARALSAIMREGFLSAGIYNPRAARLDYNHSVQDFKGMPSSARVPVVRLPYKPGVAGVEQLANEVIPAIGTIEERASLYPQYPWYTAKDGYLNAFNEAKEKGTNMSIDAATQFMLEKARRKEQTVPPSN